MAHNNDSIIFLNLRQVQSGIVADCKLPRDYISACQFLHCGAIDRTGTLDQGFDYGVLDPIPKLLGKECSFADICDKVATEIILEAAKSGRHICVLWSGGIDSTTALIAIMKAAQTHEQCDRVQILLSIDSVHEYPAFYLHHIHNRYRVKPITHPIADFLDPNCITVTGEHGDQLFGSVLLKPYVQAGTAQLDYREVLPFILAERFGSVKKADRVMYYLEDQILMAPVPILTLFDCLWWLNFSLKWQQVTLRLPVFRREQARELYEATYHFFRDTRFQSWSLSNLSVRLTPTWELYKYVAKQYILSFTGDIDYYCYKEKEPSLKRVLVVPDSIREQKFEIFMRNDFSPVFHTV